MKKKISLIANPTKTGYMRVVERACSAIEQAGLSAEVHDSPLEMFRLNDASAPLCYVVIGGDGTVLRAVSSAVNNGLSVNAPILGINLGKIGFFSETDIDGFPAVLEKFLSGEFAVEQAAMLRAEAPDGREFVCLNDFVIAKRGFSSVAHFEVLIDGAGLGATHADGVIVSSTTGSTGYTISAGGPIVSPGLDVMLVTPICPHSLTVRPVVASFESRVTVAVHSDCTLHSDGAQLMELDSGSVLSITKAGKSIGFVRVGERNIFRLIREKLM